MGLESGIEGNCLACGLPLLGESQNCSHYTDYHTPYEKHEPSQTNLQCLQIGLCGQMLKLGAKFRLQDGHSLF